MKQKIEEEAERILLKNYESYYRLAYSYVKMSRMLWISFRRAHTG